MVNVCYLNEIFGKKYEIFVLADALKCLAIRTSLVRSLSTKE